MGNKQNGKIIEIIDNPTEAGSVQTLFNQFDQDKNGQLDKEEWKLFGKYLWLANVKGAKEDVKAEVREEFKKKAPAMAGMMGSMAATGTGLLGDQVLPKDVDAWVENMFDVADKDKSGGLSYDEFISFLQNESKAEKEAERVKIRNAVADNMDQHGGQLNVTVTKGAVTKSVQVGVKADSDAVRNHQQ